MPKYEPIEDWKRAREQSVRERFRPKHARKPLTANHLRYKAAIAANQFIICTGFAGCGKTTLACEAAVDMVNSGRVDRIILTRPLVECGGEVGFLPGDIEDKVGPYFAPMIAALKQILTDKGYEEWKMIGKIKIYPLEYMRGSTHSDSIVILDEAQNAEYVQLKMLMTRLGENCTIVINGDTTQNDLDISSPLIRVIEAFKYHPQRPGITFLHMERADCLRPEIIQFIDEVLSGPVGPLYNVVDDFDPPPSYGDGFNGCFDRFNN